MAKRTAIVDPVGQARAIGYVRVSTDKQADFGVSLETQAAKVRAMAELLEQRFGPRIGSVARRPRPMSPRCGQRSATDDGARCRELEARPLRIEQLGGVDARVLRELRRHCVEQGHPEICVDAIGSERHRREELVAARREVVARGDHQALVAANPMTPIVEGFRAAWLGAGTVSIGAVLYSAAVTVVVLLAGLVLFNRVERTFMDTV